MQYFYYVIGETENGKHYYWAEKIAAGNNIAGTLAKRELVHPCKTWTEARELAGFWNDCCRENGTYMFSEPF